MDERRLNQDELLHTSKPTSARRLLSGQNRNALPHIPGPTQAN
jgi:hypothetical protein